ncbi:efflux RND transporter periplasmic adaptor subunit [Solimonas terrae]|uniref:HlyD family secretion protein n=1 Tax=Solimonas terrae TaxID=1396819 RepID=A0A6M2BUU0_9GAMM|nr:HlyD family secretion protein [Solimonas terrae]NGY05883.1 HlyD family secretion protein [Solimonas terrae]
MNPVQALRVLMTLAISVAAVLIGIALWDHYMLAPWTRDGRVRADIVAIAPDVAGLVTEIAVRDNQFVHQGDLLLRIDPERYRLAVTQAEAALKARDVDRRLRAREAARRAKLDGLVISSESRETTASQAAAADAQYDEAQAALDVARLNLARAEVHAPVDGYVTNFTAQVGDYASVGKPVLALINAHSYYVVGYFEETKLPKLHVGDAAHMRLMDGGELRGTVESVPHGINDHNDAVGRSMLADVNPTFNWVRLAQRIPVRVHIDTVPDGTQLVAGQTCSVVIDEHGAR